ncbi:hypothetical protein [Streptomyces iconiensis]|uniref:Uncharacterized protein n=1 Tax=Streptomyces iconiensis TaxID=1384038 RepID=A0ABT7A026_9ACTN|nr:hypothetical protein [Streptomyces iconiensis]MDJ1134669.1 hypothetical protein [Streptomyces iconiensis]
MGLFRLLRLPGFKEEVKHPAEGVQPRSAEDVKAALSGLNGPDVPWAVRDGTPEHADLVAEWRLAEPAFRHLFSLSQLTRTLRIRVRLFPEEREVRAIEEQWEVTWYGDPPRMKIGHQASRGPGRSWSKDWAVERGPDGRRRLRESFSFDSGDMKRPIRNAVLEQGWTWRSLLSEDF